MAIYQSEMLNFAYNASLHAHHPSRSLIDLGDRIGITTRRFHNAGDPRRTPAGTSLPSVYSDNYWCGDIRTEDQQDITALLRRVVTDFLPHRKYLHDIADTGGEVCVFIGVGSSRCCAHQFDRQLLADLAATGLDLRIDFYGPELPQRELHPQIGDTA